MVVAFWLRALLRMRAALQASLTEAAPALLRFANATPAVLAILVAAGLELAVIQLGHVSALWATLYGQLLVLKLLLVVVLLLLGAWNGWCLMALVQEGHHQHRVHLVRSITAELIVAAPIFGVVASWRFKPLPRSIVQGEPVSLHLHVQASMAHLMVNSDKAGAVTMTIMLIQPNGAALLIALAALHTFV